MALGEVKLSQSLPVSKTPPISAKREFESLILQICRIAANARSSAAAYIETLMSKSEENTQNQTRDHKVGNYAEILGGPVTLAVLGSLVGRSAYISHGKPSFEEICNNAPAIMQTASSIFQMGSKVGEIGKNYFSTSQYSHQMEKEKIQQANTQWQTWANGLQDIARNLEAARQRLQQMEDTSNR